MFYVLEMSNICNIQCRGCSSRLKLRPQGFMNTETLRDIVDQNIKHNPNFIHQRIVMHGFGASLLNPNFFKNLDLLESKGFDCVDFSDNGMLFTEEVSRKLSKYKIFNYIKISLNSSRKELMEYINTGSKFETVVKNIQTFCDVIKECGQPFQIQIQLMHTNKNMDEKPEEIINLIGRDNFQVLECQINCMPYTNDDNDLMPSKDLLIKDHYFQGGKCDFSEQSIMYFWNGDIVGCCLDSSGNQVYGNIKDGIYSEKVESNRNKLREELSNNIYDNLPVCKICEGKNLL
jgi:MoaA/NifB/PqqE/SkfB family radical SAM enzyme